MPVVRYELEGDSTSFVRAADKAGDAILDVGKDIDRTKRKVGRLSSDMRGKGAKGFEAMKEAAEGFGGSLGGAVGLIEKFGKSTIAMGGALGPVAAIVVGAGLALGALGFAAFKVGEQMIAMVRSVEQALPKLEELSAFGIPPATIQSIKDTVAALDAMGGAFKRLGAFIIGEFAPKVMPAVEAFIGLIVTGGGAAVKQLASMVGAFNRFLALVSPAFALGDAIGSWVRETVAASEQWNKLRDTGRSFIGEWANVNAEIKKTATAIKEVTEAATEEMAVVISMQSLQQLVNEERAAADEAWLAAVQFRILLRRQEAAELDEQLRKEAQLRDEIVAQIGATGSALSTIAANNVDRANQERETLEALADLEGSQHAAVRQRANERLKFLDKQQRKQENLALAGFRLEQSAAVSQIIINGALAITRALAELGPIAGAAASFAIGTTMGLQTSAVLGAAPPQFHDGGRHSDEMPAVVRRNEATLNQRATETNDVDALNQATGGQRSVVLVLEDAGRQIGEALLRELERPGDVRTRFLDLVGA